MHSQVEAAPQMRLAETLSVGGRRPICELSH